MAKAKKQTAPEPGTNTITDIGHEVVTAESTPFKAEPLEVTAEEVPQTLEMVVTKELKRYELADAAITQWKKKYGKLKIKGVDDKEGYNKVKAAWQFIRGKRLAVVDKHEEIKADYMVITRAIDGEKNRLVDLVKPLEDELRAKMQVIEDAKEAEKKRKAKEEEDRLNDRVEKLCNLGATMQGGYYKLGDTISMDIATLRSMTAEQYDSLHEAAVAKAAELKAAKEKEEQKAEEERKRLAKQKKDQDDQAAELKRQQEELAQKQLEFKKQQEQLVKMKRDARQARMEGIGFKTEWAVFKFDNGFKAIVKSHPDVFDVDDSVFDALLLDLTAQVKDAHDAKAKHLQEQADEKAALDKKKTAIGDQMAAAGFTYNYTTETFLFQNPVEKIEAKMPWLIGLPSLQEQIDLWIPAIQKAKETHEQNEKDRKAKAENERMNLLSDHGIVNEFIEKLRPVAAEFYGTYYPMLKTDAAKESMIEFSDRLKNLLDDYTIK